LGGFGGPYRLDGGHQKVYQVPQWQKDQVPEEVKQGYSCLSLAMKTKFFFHVFIGKVVIE
jgi:hypothetical protein